MNIFDFHKTILNTSADYLKKLAVFNPLTIRKKGTKSKAIFALALVCILWGTTWIASKEGVSHMPALQLAGIRQLIAGILYVGFFFYKGAALPKGKEWIPILVLSFLNFIMSNGLSTWGVQYISAGLGSIMGAIFPLWLVVIGLFISKEKLPRNAIIGLLLGFSGVCIIFSDHLQDFLNPDFRKGIILSLIATWTWAFATLYTKQQAMNFNPYFSLGLQMLISAVALISFTSATGNAVPVSKIPWQSWAAIAYLIVFGSLIAFICYLYALQNLPTEQASIYAYINPIVAVLCGWIVFGEKVTIFITIGGLVTLLGVYLVNKAFKAIPPPEQPETEGM
ncbi:MAG: EamA family transporter [Chitinophagaceae bacterium]|jgi:drug/metabolite transporter (DMT)-like permease|nr:EamA family transporter [Chitinophagaceae bacterium]MBK7678419.1 EamA family transporter [Chitinophagaceae bacterium]MBK8300222.1 EamA family transporter [Chitinophagaceae bacterium]MBK9464266.1 EamA family transporter [Chitinophagaceae bacterium]MBK9658610.1 EamA family transporter [Chitinophagaceae bacterium]